MPVFLWLIMLVIALMVAAFRKNAKSDDDHVERVLRQREKERSKGPKATSPNIVQRERPGRRESSAPSSPASYRGVEDGTAELRRVRQQAARRRAGDSFRDLDRDDDRSSDAGARTDQTPSEQLESALDAAIARSERVRRDAAMDEVPMAAAFTLSGPGSETVTERDPDAEDRLGSDAELAPAHDTEPEVESAGEREEFTGPEVESAGEHEELTEPEVESTSEVVPEPDPEAAPVPSSGSEPLVEPAPIPSLSSDFVATQTPSGAPSPGEPSFAEPSSTASQYTPYRSAQSASTASPASANPVGGVYTPTSVYTSTYSVYQPSTGTSGTTEDSSAPAESAPDDSAEDDGPGGDSAAAGNSAWIR